MRRSLHRRAAAAPGGGTEALKGPEEEPLAAVVRIAPAAAAAAAARKRRPCELVVVRLVGEDPAAEARGAPRVDALHERREQVRPACVQQAAKYLEQG